MKKTYVVFLLLIIALLFSCAGGQKESYTRISQEEAKQMMDSEEECVVLDVRTVDEYQSGHIENAVVIPYDEIPQKAESILKDKDQKILVYCRSGNRSKKGAASLVQAGYTNVYEFGGINTWPYEIVK